MEASSSLSPCAREGCTNPVEQPATGGHPRRYCSDACRAADRRARLARERAATPVLSAEETGPSDLGAQLVATATTLAQLALAVRSALVTTGADATQARLAQVEASAAERIANAERRLGRGYPGAEGCGGGGASGSDGGGGTGGCRSASRGRRGSEILR